MPGEEVAAIIGAVGMIFFAVVIIIGMLIHNRWKTHREHRAHASSRRKEVRRDQRALQTG